MKKEEIMEYLDRVEDLFRRLEGDDKDTLHWLVFGYNECARILNETEKELEECEKRIEDAIKYNEYLCNLYEGGMESLNAQANLVILKGNGDEE